jgi:alpha-ribazole phosphatase/probable phosphoglycerate mutase
VLADRLNLTVKVDPRLQEVSLGDWEGELFDDIAQNYPEHIAERRANPVHSRPPGGESVAEVAARMAQAANDITRAHPEEPVIIVSHGLALATLICLARQIPLSQVFKLIPENATPEVIDWPSPPEAAQPGQFFAFGIDRNN